MRPNILFITADDLNCDSVGAFGCPVANITPNLDRLAAEGMRLDHGHVTIAVCQPSRQCLMTGRYPHRNGGEGFFPIARNTPTLQEQLSDAGYLNGILGKVIHLAPIDKFCWDYQQDQPDLGRGRSPELYGKYTQEFLEQAKESGKPFFLMANSHDPHRPFADSDQERDAWGTEDLPPFSRRLTEDEVVIPGFLPELPEVRQEVAEYFTSVYRCDEIVGAVLGELEASGLADNTLVIFLSDNGMAFPFAKTNCYLASTHTPLIMRWPGHIKPGSVEDKQMINGIDFTPTLLDVCGLDQLPGTDGKSFLPVLHGEEQDGRDHLFTEFHETAGRRRYPMRCVQTPDYGYILNIWSDGERVFRNESQSGRTFAAMEEAADESPDIANRINMFLHRQPEEFYDLRNDPDCLHNLIDVPEHKSRIDEFRAMLLAQLERVGDPAAGPLKSVLSPAIVKAYMNAQEELSKQTREQRKRENPA